jgi:hypothetical protein
MTVRKFQNIAAVIGAVTMLWTAVALAKATPAEKCAAAKDLAAGKYGACRLQAEKKAELAGTTADYSKCDTAYAKAWGKAESKYGAACPTSGDQAGVGTDVMDFTTCLGGDLGGTPGACDVTALQTSVNTCNGNLSSCNTNLGMCNAGTATAADVLNPKTFSSSAGLNVTGTMPNNAPVIITPGTSSQTIPLGYHNGSGSVAGDTNLVPGNIVLGASIFGVAGLAAFGSQPLQTGQITLYAVGDDGTVQRGAAVSYTDNHNGTITDNKTGLMWEKKDAFDSTPDSGNLDDADNTYPWAGNCSAPDTSCNSGGTCCQTNADCTTPPCTIIDGEGDTPGLTIFGWVAALNTANFAGHNDWRIPNLRELETIFNYGNANDPAVGPTFQGASCDGVNPCYDIMDAACSCTEPSSPYWSSTTYASDTRTAWYVYSADVSTSWDNKPFSYSVRAVRGGTTPSAVVGGYRWFLGGGGASCDDTCTAQGLVYSAATLSYAGSGGTDANCNAVLDALAVPNISFLDGGPGGVGCFYCGPGCERNRDLTPTTSSATYPIIVQRACACQ